MVMVFTSSRAGGRCLSSRWRRAWAITQLLGLCPIWCRRTQRRHGCFAMAYSSSDLDYLWLLSKLGNTCTVGDNFLLSLALQLEFFVGDCIEIPWSTLGRRVFFPLVPWVANAHTAHILFTTTLGQWGWMELCQIGLFLVDLSSGVLLTYWNWIITVHYWIIGMAMNQPVESVRNQAFHAAQMPWQTNP